MTNMITIWNHTGVLPRALVLLSLSAGLARAADPTQLRLGEMADQQSSKPTTAGQTGDAATKPDATNGFIWPSAIPADCPFPRSTSFTGIYFTGRHSDYRVED